MLDKLVAFFKLPKEYGNVQKVIWLGDELEIINYKALISYSSKELVFSEVKLRGSSLRLVYQDPYVVKISGKIQEIIKGEF